MRKKNWIILSISLVLLDQGIKKLIRSWLTLYEKKMLIPSFFSLTYVENQGAAWSLFQQIPWLLTLFSFVVSIGIFSYLWKKKMDFLSTLSLTFVFSGAVGNLIDRLVLGAVTDYLSFTFGSFSFPVFNLADMFVVVGLFFLLGIELWRDKNGNKSR